MSAFLTPRGTDAKLPDALKRGNLILAYGDAIEADCRDVLHRTKLAIDPALVGEFLDR